MNTAQNARLNFPVILISSAMVSLILGIIWLTQCILETVASLSASLLIAVIGLNLVTGFQSGFSMEKSFSETL